MGEIKIEKKCIYTPKEISCLLGIGITKTYDLIHEKVIPSIKIGRKYIIPKTALDQWLKCEIVGDSNAG